MSSSAPGRATAFAPPVPLEVLAERARLLGPASPRQRPGSSLEAPMAVDGLLARVARGRGALDVALAEGLAALAEGDRLLRLGYSCCADYARERLGVAARTAQAMVQLGRELRARPLLRQAVRRGEVSSRKAQAVLPVAVGEAEQAWVERARSATVRALEKAVREVVAERGREKVAARTGAGMAGWAGGADVCAALEADVGPGASAPPPPPPAPASAPDEEPWERIEIDLAWEVQEKLDQAMELAGRLLGATAPKFQRLEAMCQEYVAAHPEEADETEADRVPLWPGGPRVSEPVGVPLPPDWLEPLREALERETRCWALLDAPEPVEAPPLASLPDDSGPAIPLRIDAELRELAAMRQRWDGLLGHLAMLVRRHRLWRDLGFASFGHYCVERLGMAARTVEQRAWLARRLCELPSLRRAMDEGRICYEKARILAVCDDDAEVVPCIDWAEPLTCIALRRETELAEDLQMRARHAFRLRVPRRVRVILEAAFRAARKVARRWLPPLLCLLRVAEHFIATWKDEPAPRRTPQRRAIERGLGWCQVPGCSRAAVHAHHIVPRARGGEDEDWNLVGLCAGHHLHGVHRGWVRVRGRAPDQLAWELGERGGDREEEEEALVGVSRSWALAG
jgi:hypothetical protein